MGAWLISDEVYLGAEIDRDRTPSFWGSNDRVIVTSGLSKAFGIPGLRIGWIVGPKPFVHECWTQHDYTTIAPNKLSDMMASVAVERHHREQLFDRTRRQLQHNWPIVREWTEHFAGLLTCHPPEAGAICLVRYHHDIPSFELAERIRENQSTLVVPGSFLGLEGYLRIWFGGHPDYVREGLRRIGVELERLR